MQSGRLVATGARLRMQGVTVRNISAAERGSNFTVALLLAIARDVAAPLLRAAADRPQVITCRLATTTEK